MVLKVYCDWCGKEVDKDDCWCFDMHKGLEEDWITFDLCNECKDKLVKAIVSAGLIKNLEVSKDGD